MANFKHRRPRTTRAGCKYCKPHKGYRGSKTIPKDKHIAADKADQEEILLIIDDTNVIQSKLEDSIERWANEVHRQ